MTVAKLIEAARRTLDDEDVQKFEWSDDELVDYLNQAIDYVCEETYILEDASTSAICQISLVGTPTYTHTYSLDSRIIRVKRAKLSSQSVPITTFVPLEYMDLHHPGWESAAYNTPTIIIDEGVGTDKIRVWPTPAVNDTLNLIVYRRQTARLTVADVATSPEIPERYHEYLVEGIVWKAYEKNDEETEAQKKADKYHTLFLRNVEEIKRRQGRRMFKQKTIVPQSGAR